MNPRGSQHSAVEMRDDASFSLFVDFVPVADGCSLEFVYIETVRDFEGY